MLSFGRVPVPYGAVPHKPVVVAEEKEQSDERQHRSRYYAAVLPAAVSGLPRPSSHPTSGSAVRIPSASVDGSASSRFARSNLSSAHSSHSHSLPSPHQRSQPIDIPAGRRSAAVSAQWYRTAWQGAADETDGSGSSASSGDSDGDAPNDWCVSGRRQLSESFVDDSQLSWCGRNLDDEHTALQNARWSKQPQQLRYGDSDGEVEEDDEEDADGSLCLLPFPLLAPSYHVDFELN